ncbi:MAG TPA: TOBE domain-containing protein [Terriglobia bacterium]|nr:TOBE domain-containing protein [Terriglobia bacterium]
MPMELLHLPEAARELGVSIPTLKQWIYGNKLRSIQTAGGHHRIPRAEIDRMLFKKGGGGNPPAPVRTPKGPQAKQAPSQGAGLEHIISGRNQLVGRIVGLHSLGLLTKVTLDVCGQRVTAIITRDASRDLGLKVGETAAALIKATEVMIIRPGGRVA